MRQRTGRADFFDVHFGDVDTCSGRRTEERHARRWPRSLREHVGRRFGKEFSVDWASVKTPASGTLYKRGCHLFFFANVRVPHCVRAWCSTLPAVTPPTSQPKGFGHSA